MTREVGTMRKTAFALTLVLLGCCLLAVGCGSADSTTTTLLGGGSTPGDTIGAGTATTLGSTATTLAVGGTPITGESGNTILGKWHNNVTGETLEFFPNGVVTGSRFADMKGVEVTYAINVDQITISALGTILVTQTFSIDGNTLTIIDNATGVSGTLQRVN
jgi:hypothetical protein